MDEIYNNTQGYDIGINNDRWEHWRNDGDIGYVHLAFKVVSEAIYDLIAGEPDDIISASYFFFGEEGDIESEDAQSIRWVWLDVLGMESLPETVLRHKRDGYVSQEEIEFFRQLCTTMKTI